jgi:hypothetical protein
MSEKQDRQGARTPADLERKWQFGKRFAEIMGVALDAQNSISVVESSLHYEILEQVTSITRDVEQILLAATASYVETDELEKLKATFESELAVMADLIAMNFEASIERTENVDGELQTVQEYLEQHFEFSVDGLLVKAGENSMGLRLKNNLIQFEENGQQFGWWDGVNFYTGNIVVNVNERAQFGNFAFIPRSNGSLDFLKVGG